ncbi:MAG: DEAD/DEAH box helicase family protein, partial [Acidaminococcaceae bacterium]|nr:DEAD/DEAH box helicase family protein [Acidaminococcaceae bacterium]
MELRDYQKELINKIRSEIIKEKKTICAVLGCGGGKSVIQGMIAKSATQKKNEVLFIVHRKELCQQIENTFRTCGVDFTYCIVGMVQTLCRRVPKLKEPKLILVDECHHILSNSYRKIIDSFPQAVVVGFTATPVRMNEGGLGAVFESLVESVSTKWLIEHHYLAPYKYYGVELADTRHLHTKNGEFIPDEVE